MSRLVSNIAFSFLLLFHSAAMAEEETSPTEPYAEEQEAPEVTEDTQPKAPSDANEEQIEASEPEDGLSEAEKEALAAEAAELRESGIYDEPIEE